MSSQPLSQEPEALMPPTAPSLRRRLYVLSREIAITVIMAIALFMATQAVVQNFRVAGPSMEPTVSPAQYLLVNKLAYLRIAQENPMSQLALLNQANQKDGLVYLFGPPQRGDIVVFHSSSCPTSEKKDRCIKRVVGLPGETIQSVDGAIHINGILLEEPYLSQGDRKTTRTYVIPPRNYYLMGDNRSASYDSRNWGAVPIDNIVGKVWVRYWPPSDMSTLRTTPSTTDPSLVHSRTKQLAPWVTVPY